jgi:chromosome segregation ATPase
MAEQNSRTIPVAKDLLYQARKQFPGYEDQAALTLYIIDQFGEQSEVDKKQTQLINNQKNENDKLKNALGKIGQELDNLERESVDNDTEIERLKQLIDKLKPSSELTQQTALLSQQEIEKIESELEKLRNKPGMDVEKFNDLNSKVQDILKMPGISTKEVEELEKTIQALEKKNVVTNALYTDVKQELDSKEQRFRKYIMKKGEQIKKITKSSAEEIADYKKKIDQEFEEIRKEHGLISDMRNNIQKDAEKVANIVDYAKGLVSEPQDVKRPFPLLPVTQSDKEEQQLIMKAQARSPAKRNKQEQTPTVIDIEESINEGITPLKTYRSPIYRKWVYDTLPILVREFKKRHYEVEKEYPDEQIASTIEDHVAWLWQVTSKESPNVTEKQFNTFMEVIAHDLFKQQPNLPLDLREGLSTIYENILDDILNKTLFKNN